MTTSRGKQPARRQSTSGRHTNTTNRGRRNRRRTPRWNYIQIVLYGTIILLIIILLIFGIRSMFKRTNTQTTVSSTEAESELEAQVKVDDIVITGMTYSEAEEEILKKYTWKMQAYLGEDTSDTYELSDLAKAEIDKVLDQIYQADGNLAETYTLNFDDLEQEIQSEVEAMQAKWNVAAKNGSISGFDKTTNTFTYAAEEDGIEIDAEKLAADIQTALDTRDFDAKISVETSVVKPTITAAQAKEAYEVIGTFTTNTTSNADRNTNIQIATEAINGVILAPGEEFSFNNTTGNRTTDKGYRPAGAYVNGVLVEEPGGGVCQVSSTLYNAVVFSGLKTTERHAHSYEPSYVTPGEDAMVSYDGYAGPDMKFINNSDSSIVIRATFSNQKLTMSIVGIPVLEEGVTVSMTSTKTAELDAPEAEYVEDATLTPGTEVVVKEATNGSRWVTNIVTKKDGTIISDEFLHNSTYKGKPATIKRNTTGVVETTEGVSDTIESSGEASETSGSATIETVVGPAGTLTTGAASTTTQTTVASTTASETLAQTSASEVETTVSSPTSGVAETVEPLPQ